MLVIRRKATVGFRGTAGHFVEGLTPRRKSLHQVARKFQVPGAARAGSARNDSAARTGTAARLIIPFLRSSYALWLSNIYTNHNLQRFST